MRATDPNLLSTGQAAKLCSVTSDTVLKWIKKGRVNAVRTPGGHYRIDRSEIEPLVVSRPQVSCAAQQRAELDPNGMHCWEYLSDGESVRDCCRQCVVYRVRAARCYLLADTDPGIGHAREFCQGACESCSYYRFVQGLATNVLVITPDETLITRLAGEDNDNITLSFARNGYEASAAIRDFQAAWVVVDEDVLRAGDRGLLEYLADDPRLPGVKIMLAASHAALEAPSREIARDVIWGVIEKPFDLRRLTAAIAESDFLSRSGHHARNRF